MKPKELLERLRFLSTRGKLTDTIIHAPLSPARTGDEISCGDLMHFVDWVDKLQENSWKYEDLKR